MTQHHFEDQKEALLEYLAQKEADQSKTVQDIFEKLEQEFNLTYSSFSGWVKQFNDEIERIAHSGNLAE